MAFGGNAQARPFLGGFLPVAVQLAVETQCASSTSPGHRAVPPSGYASVASKSSAILGGAPSALDRIRLQQAAAGNAIADQIAAGPQAVTLAGATLEPALGASPARQYGCGIGFAPAGMAPKLSASAPVSAIFSPVAPQITAANEFLASKRIAIRRTNFDNDWARVRNQGVSAGQLRRFAGASHSDRTTLISSVNREVNHRIRYVEDSQLFGKADYWAGARATLRLGKGDCEDIALAKMQLLAAAGVPRADMILTIARDLARNADHAVLIVRDEGRFLLLDNSTDKVLDARYSYDYRPVLSFSEGRRWLHGY